LILKAGLACAAADSTTAGIFKVPAFRKEKALPACRGLFFAFPLYNPLKMR
jgi:hypothetical protein